MKTRRLGVIMNGVTGRMGANQHLARSVLAIRQAGGVRLADGSSVLPDPILVGRNREKLEALSARHGVPRWTTDLDAALSNPEDTLYFDAQVTSLRVPALRKAIAAGKDVYCEKPTADSLADAMALCRLAREAGVRHGVVQDKLWLPGILKLKSLIDSGFFGRILSVRGEFGYWVFTGETRPPQRPSWNYRAEDGGGIIVDMLCHWRYLLDNLFGNVVRLTCLGKTHIPVRYNEEGKKYEATADDASYATFELENGVIAHINSSWCVRVRRDDLVTFQVDGTKGSAVAGLRTCYIQSDEKTPRPVWNPDIEQAADYFADWDEVPDQTTRENAFKAEWVLFIRHLFEDTPFPWDLLEGAKGVQLAELGLKSWSERRWVDVPELEI